MKRTSTASILLIVVLVFISAAGILAQENDEAPRTYYDELDLDTPEAAAQTFVEAFQQLDFLTVYLILSPQAQETIERNYNLLRFNDVVNRRVNLSDLLSDGEAEQVGSPFLFDWLMMQGATQDGLLIDLRGDVELGAIRLGVTQEGDSIIEIPATVEGIDGEVRFHTVMSPSSRWRVHQVIVPGGDEERIPWAALPPFGIEAIALWETPCDNTPLNNLPIVSSNRTWFWPRPVENHRVRITLITHWQGLILSLGLRLKSGRGMRKDAAALSPVLHY